LQAKTCGYTLYAASLLSAVLAMKTKEMAFTLPIIITLYEFIFFEGKIKKRFFFLIPFFLTMLIIPLAVIGMNKPITDVISTVLEATKVPNAMPMWDYLLTQFRVIVTYIRLLFLPINQNLDYDYPVYTSFFNPNVYLSFLFLLGIFGLGVYLFYRSLKKARSSLLIAHNHPPQSPLSKGGSKGGWCYEPSAMSHERFIAFGIFWFFITLSIESTIIPISPSLLFMSPIRADIDVILEHRVYLPSVGIFITISTAAFIITNKLKSKWQIANKIVILTLIAITIALLIATHTRNAVWQDEVSLWEDVVRKSPNKMRGHNNLGAVYAAKGWFDKAIEHYQIALRLKPNITEIYYNAAIYYNLGKAYDAKGLIDKAIEHYQTALRLKPDFAEAYNNLGLVYEKNGLSDEAMKYYNAALRLNPEFKLARDNLNRILQVKR